ncbi:MAG: HEAT repeat domain-containing protein [Microcoleaceae cyanobacterium MO_207.B10]|nr:HEAT repeat domain-containing protein [Microcoleaceae cyanobacterium MO_207.B10]
MTKMLNSQTQVCQEPVLLSPEDTEALLQQINEQIESNTFNSNDQYLLKQMIESFGDKRGMVRLGFAEALGKVGKPATPFLEAALTNHANPVVRRAAAKTITLIADPNAVPTLVKALLKDEDTVVQCSSVGALASIGEPAVPELINILASSEYSESAKGLAIWALSFIGTEAKNLMYAQMSSESPEVRAAVVGVMAKVAQEESDAQAYDLLVKALNDPAMSVRCEAAATLSNLSYQPAVPQLIELLTHADWESRKAAALALMKMGNSTILANLETALTQETEMAVQQVLKLAISHIQKQSVEEN